MFCFVLFTKLFTFSLLNPIYIRSVINSGGLVPLCLGGSKNFFSCVFRKSKNFSRGYFVGPKFFLVGISGVNIFSRGYFRGSKIFSRGYFGAQKFFSWIFSWVQNFFSWIFSWVQNFFSWIFRGSKCFFRRCFIHTSWKARNKK